MGKFITLREEFESETGAHPFADQQYIEWLEKLVERQRKVKNCSIPDVVVSEAELCRCSDKRIKELRDDAIKNGWNITE